MLELGNAQPPVNAFALSIIYLIAIGQLVAKYLPHDFEVILAGSVDHKQIETRTVEGRNIAFKLGSNEPFSGYIRKLSTDSDNLESLIKTERGISNGKAFFFYDTGELKSEINYVDGVAEGSSYAWDKGDSKLKTEAKLRGGKLIQMLTKVPDETTELHFLLHEFHENETISKEGFLRDGKRYGNWTEYYPNEEKKSEIYYKDGLPEGEATYWTEEGIIEKVVNYKNGLPVEDAKNNQKPPTEEKNQKSYTSYLSGTWSNGDNPFSHTQLKIIQNGKSFTGSIKHKEFTSRNSDSYTNTKEETFDLGTDAEIVDGVIEGNKASFNISDSFGGYLGTGYIDARGIELFLRLQLRSRNTIKTSILSPVSNTEKLSLDRPKSNSWLNPDEVTATQLFLLLVGGVSLIIFGGLFFSPRTKQNSSSATKNEKPKIAPRATAKDDREKKKQEILGMIALAKERAKKANNPEQGGGSKRMAQTSNADRARGTKIKTISSYTDKLLGGAFPMELIMKIVKEEVEKRAELSPHDTAIFSSMKFFVNYEQKESLFNIQLEARAMALKWLQDGLVDPHIVKLFEDSLYHLYHPEKLDLDE